MASDGHLGSPRSDLPPRIIPARPDVEVFWADDLEGEDGERRLAGWYWQSAPVGPFETESEALENAQD